MRRRLWHYPVSVLVFACVASAQVTVTVEPAQEFQTIEGFGAHGAANVWWDSGPFYTDWFGTAVIENLGFTMIRNEFYPDYEPTNDNGDPNSLGSFNMNGIFGTKQKNYLISMKNKALASGEPLQFIASYWSPPAWMKQNNSTTGTDGATNVLRTGVEAELGEYGVATVKAYKDECGIDLYALSMQNEPAFGQTFNSCVYTPVRYKDVFKVFANRVHTTYPDVKMFGAEHMLANWGTFEGQLSSDTAARRHIHAFAVHGYSDGVHPTQASQAVSYWKRAAQNTASAGKTLWMTETSGYFETWDGCMKLAESIYAALKYGKISAWVWWQLGGGTVLNEYDLMTRETIGMRAYIHKHFARYVRPGAVGIGSVSNDTLLFSAAFRHKTDRTLTIVIINPSSASKSVVLDGAGLPSFTMYRSTSNERCANVGTVSGASVTVPASSVVTLFGSGYDPVTAVRSQLAVSARTRVRKPGVEFLIDGRTTGAIASGAGVRLSAGVGGTRIAIHRIAR